MFRRRGYTEAKLVGRAARDRQQALKAALRSLKSPKGELVRELECPSQPPGHPVLAFIRRRAKGSLGSPVLGSPDTAETIKLVKLHQTERRGSTPQRKGILEVSRHSNHSQAGHEWPVPARDDPEALPSVHLAERAPRKNHPRDKTVWVTGLS